MRVRLALTLFVALVLALLAIPADARELSGIWPVGRSAVPATGSPVDPSNPASHLHVGRPRAAVTTVFDSAAEAFLSLDASDAAAPVPAPPAGSALGLVADYEAVVLPLTAGTLHYELAVWKVGESGREPIGSDDAEVVSFGPFRRAGRLVVRVGLEPGLHHLFVSLTARARAVGVAEWQTDEDTADLWVFVPPALDAYGSEPGTDAARASAPWMASDDDVGAAGGVFVGSQRGAAGPNTVGALNFETNHDATFTVRTGEPVRFWTDYELWWTDDASGAGRVALTLYRRESSALNPSPLAVDVEEPATESGPFLADGALEARTSFDLPGTYYVDAVLSTRISNGSARANDEDRVTVRIKVVDTPNDDGAIAGIVTSEDGIALEGVIVEARGARSDTLVKTRSNGLGEYLLEGLPPGEYIVSAQPEGLNYLPEWWKESRSAGGAVPVPVMAGATADGIDFTLTPGGTISGRVTDAAGNPLAGIEIVVGHLMNARPVVGSVQPVPVAPAGGSIQPVPVAPAGGSIQPVPVAPAGGSIQPVPAALTDDDDDDDRSSTVLGRARTSADGYYAIDRLPEGGYWVRASDPEGKYLTEFWDDEVSLADADLVRVERGKHTAGIDFELTGGGAIEGVVNGGADAGVIGGLAGIVVEAHSADDPAKVLGRTVTGRGGRYRLGGLGPGLILARAIDDNGRYGEEWYEEAADAGHAKRIEIVPGRVRDGINFTLGQTPHRARLFIRPSVVGLAVGGTGEFAVSVADVRNLAAFEVALRWDPAVFEASEVVLGDFLGSTGRQVIPVEPVIDNDAGQLRYGAASIGPEPGASGEGVLFRVRIAAREPGETAVVVAESVLTDPAAAQIEHDRTDGRVSVGRCMRGDFDCNCVIDIVDVMALVMRWGSSEGDPDYDVAFDLDADGDIDIVDVQIEASLWGRRCTATPVDSLHIAGSPTIGLPDGKPAEGARLGLDVQPATAAPGAQVTVVVSADLDYELAGFEMDLQFDPSKVRLVSAGLGELVTTSDRTFLPLGPSAEEGVVHLGAFSFDGPAGPADSGELAWFTFAVVANGPTAFAVDRALTVDSTGNGLPAAGARLTVDTTAVATAASYLPIAHSGE